MRTGMRVGAGKQSRRMVVVGLSVAILGGCDKSGGLRKAGPRQDARAPAARTIDPEQLVELITLDPTFRLDLRYATTNNFMGRKLYSQARAFMAGAAAQALVRAHKRAGAEGFGFTIYDAYRPFSVTKALWNATPPGPQRNYVANPKQGSRHNRGCAVDLTLHNIKTGQPVEMPSAFDDFSVKAHRSYGDDSPAARRHAQLLERVMVAEGFRGMSNEWWHFDFRGWEAFPIRDEPFDAL